MNRARSFIPLVTALVLAAAGASHTAATQASSSNDIIVRGVVVGPDSIGVPNQTIVLHRVLDGAGTTIAESVTNPNGEFELRAVGAADPNAIYFVAARFEGELYIAAPFRAADNIAPQVLIVGIPGTSATALVTPPTVTGGRALTSRNWLLFALPLTAVIAVAAYALVPRGRIPQRRALLISTAELDEKIAASKEPTDRLRAERARLVAMLRGSGA